MMIPNLGVSGTQGMDKQVLVVHEPFSVFPKYHSNCN